MSNDKVLDLIQQADALTKQGGRVHAFALIENILKMRPSPELLPSIARLANRNSAYVLAMRILYSEIQSEREGLAPARPETLAVYANSLLNIGAHEEARQCAKRGGGLNETRLIRAFINFAQWDYDKALVPLKEYILNPESSPYQVLVGRVNFAASLVSLGRFSEAEVFLLELLEDLKKDPNAKVLLGNSYELLSQVEIHQNKTLRAVQTLEKSQDVLAAFPGRYLLYVKKWRAILDLSIDPKNVSPLLKVKEEAQKLRNWETIRDCDFHLARLTDDQDLLTKIYLGTPYLGFRKRIENIYKIKPPPNQSFNFIPDRISTPPSQICWDLEDGKCLANAGVTVTALIQTMTRDLYRPPRMGLIFAGLYPEEKFNPLTSVQRIRSSVLRFNQWSKNLNTKFNFQIQIEKGDFFLRCPDSGVGLSVKIRKRALTNWQMNFKTFRKNYGAASFSSLDLAKHLKLTQKSATNLLKLGLEHQLLRKVDQGKATRYVFSDRKK